MGSVGYRFSYQDIRICISVWQRAKIPEYHQLVHGCIAADFSDQGVIFQGFSTSTRKVRRKRLEISENAEMFRAKLFIVSELCKNLPYFDISAVSSMLIIYWYLVFAIQNLRKFAAKMVDRRFFRKHR